MSTRVLANDNEEKGETGAILFDGTTGRAYGYRFDDYEQADAFVRWIEKHDGKDPCRLTEDQVARAYDEFLSEWKSCGLTPDEYEMMTKLEVWVFTTNSENGSAGRKQVRELYEKRSAARQEVFGIE